MFHTKPGHETDLLTVILRMSDAGDDIQVAVAEVEVTTETPKGKLSVEDALQVFWPSTRTY